MIEFILGLLVGIPIGIFIGFKLAGWALNGYIQRHLIEDNKK